MKIYMHWDMEGASGLFRREQAWFWKDGATEQDHEEGRRLLMADINSAVAAALAAGADQVIVCDTHHGGGNIRIPEMLTDPRVTYHDKSTRLENGHTRWMPDLDETVDGLMLPGHHAKRHTPNAFLPHGWMGEWDEIFINGESVGELGLEACYAAHWGVPLVLVQGDEAGCREAEARFPGVITAAVKRAVTEDLCAGPSAEEGRAITAARIRAALAALRQRRVAPLRPALPMTVSIRMDNEAAAERAAQRPGVRRVDALTVDALVERHGDVVKWIVGLSAP